ncbi:MAG: serine hydrolase domain-containing protein [Candidatus Poribacteria bacterium]
MDALDLGIDPERMQLAHALLDDAHAAGELPGAALLVTRGGESLDPYCVGRKYFDRDDAVTPDTVFLTASVSKPVTVSAVMLLVERGKVCLDQPACEILPTFGNRGKEAVTVRHLMTHTSGLPDMLPDNEELRAEHQPLSEFVRRMCDLDLLFTPGAAISYQSCGTAVLGAIVEEIEGEPLPAFLQRELFAPLSMGSTSLGVRDDLIPRIAHVNVGTDGRDTDWGWNTPYWWGFGAPWGGMFSTVGDISIFLNAFLDTESSPFSLATTAAMLTDQTTSMPAIPTGQKYESLWGLGWRIQPNAGSCYGDLASGGTFGHHGATGTVVWADPMREMTCALFTTQPLSTSRRLISQVCNIVAGAGEASMMDGFLL